MVCACLHGECPSALLFALWVPQFNSRDCSLVVRVSTQLPSGSSSPLEAEGLLSRCDVLGDTSLVVPGESTSVLAVMVIASPGFPRRRRDLATKDLAQPRAQQAERPGVGRGGWMHRTERW